MPHVVCITSELAGLRFAGCEVLRRLEKAGHQVTFAGPDEIGPVVEAQGIDFVPLQSPTLEEFYKEDRKLGKWSRIKSLGTRRRQAFEASGVDHFEAVMADLKPDLVLIDIELHSYIISACGRGYPVALLVQWMSIWKRPGLPMLHRDHIPGQGLKGSRLGMELVWLGFRLWKWRRRWREKINEVGVDPVSLLRAQAKQVGFPFRKETDFNQWLIPQTYRNLPNLSLRAFEFEFPHERFPNAHYVGPMVNPERREAELDASLEAKLKQLVARRQEGVGNRRLIFCGLSSHFASDSTFVSRLLDALRERPDWDLILSLGGKQSADELGQLPVNVHPFSWVPMLRVLKQVDAAVVHGGINTVDECILMGVPMLVYDAGYLDMPGTTARVVYHELGVAGDRKKDDPATIAKNLERVLDDPVIRENVTRMQESYLGYARDRRLENLIEELLTKKR